jgi:hypothetical protein
MFVHRLVLLLLLGVVGICQGMNDIIIKNDENEEKEVEIKNTDFLLVPKEKILHSLLDMHNEKLKRMQELDNHLLSIATCYAKFGKKGDFEFLSPKNFDEDKVLKKYPTLMDVLYRGKDSLDTIDMKLLSPSIIQKILIEISKGPYKKNKKDINNSTCRHVITKFNLIFEKKYLEDKEYFQEKDKEFIALLAEILKSKEKRLKKVVEKDLHELFVPCYLQLHPALVSKKLDTSSFCLALAGLIDLKKKIATSQNEDCTIS